jgi:hypothetical protein
VTTQPSLTPAAFAAKWHGVTTTEKASAQEHFIDLCRMLGEPTPHEADPIGAQYAFEKRVSKAAGGDGFADVWKRDFFACCPDRRALSQRAAVAGPRRRDPRLSRSRTATSRRAGARCPGEPAGHLVCSRRGESRCSTWPSSRRRRQTRGCRPGAPLPRGRRAGAGSRHLVQRGPDFE